MIYQTFFIPNIIVSAVLIVLVGFLLFQTLRLKKRLDVLFQKGEKNLEKILRDQFGRLEKQERDVAQILEEISRLNKISQKSFQKIGVIRFNPFNEVGGDQSFSIALLDAGDDGFVITSYYGRDANRIYAKPVADGNSQYSLSGEEKQAIEKAIKHGI